MSGLPLVVVSLALAAAVPDPGARAGRLTRDAEPVGAVILMSGRAAWSPEVLEGTRVCGADDRCAPVEAVHACVEPTCPFGFGFEYALTEDVATLPPLPPVDESLLATLDREASLQPLVEAIRRHRAPPPHPEPPPEPEPKLQVASEPLSEPEPPPPFVPLPPPEPVPETPPGPPSWIASPGWAIEGTGVPLFGVTFDDMDDEHFAVGAVITTGFRYQRQIPEKQRLFGAAFVGNQYGADIDLTVINTMSRTLLGVGLDLVSRTVYAPRDRTGPNRMRVFSTLDLLVPGFGVLFDLDGTVTPHLRLAAPVSILLREQIGLEFRLDMNVMLGDGPIAGVIMLGVGVMLRRPLE